MPNFELVSKNEAMMKTVAGKRAQIIAGYVGFIGQLQEGQAGKLQPSEGESVLAMRWRLNAAAKLAGKELVIKRVGEEMYFWEEREKRADGRQRRVRPSKEPTSEA